MSNAWSGTDPTPFSDGALVDYELGTKFHANADISVSGVRIWGGPSSTAFVGRRARIWSAAGSQLAIAVLPDQLLPGWHVYPLDAAVNVATGTDFWASDSVQDTYGAVTAPGYPVPSADGKVTATSGGLHNNPATFPNTLTASFYGVDIDYTAGAGNQRPVVGISAAVTGYLTAAATLTVSDETPSTVSYLIKWGDGLTTSTASVGPISHTYAAAGTYAVLVTATDNGGLTDSAATVVTVVAAPGVLAPNSELVAQAWLKTLPGIAAGMVSTNLPRDNATWAASGFVQVSGVVGGAQDMDTGKRNPVVSLDIWGSTRESALPPWGKAARLGELINGACVGSLADHVLLDLGTKYAPARVMAAIALSEPRRIPGDKGGYAHYTMDLLLSWVAV